MRSLLVVAGSSLLLVQPGIAQDVSQSTAAEPAEIVVRAEKNRKKRVRNFARTLTPARMDEQIGRFVSPVCPALIGLRLNQGEAIVDRFRQVAAAARVPVARKPCAANIFIIAVTSKRTFIESIPRYAPGLVQGVPDARISAMARSPSPVSAWQVPGLLDQNGLQVALSDLESGNRLTSAPTVASTDGSRLNRPTQIGLTVAVLIVERQALANMSTRQFADYAAMRTLAPINPLNDQHAPPAEPELALPADSILSLFGKQLDPADAPPSVTWWDFAFLQALYRMRMTNTASFQRGDIEAGMRKILANVPADQL